MSFPSVSHNNSSGTAIDVDEEEEEDIPTNQKKRPSWSVFQRPSSPRRVVPPPSPSSGHLASRETEHNEVVMPPGGITDEYYKDNDDDDDDDDDVKVVSTLPSRSTNDEVEVPISPTMEEMMHGNDIYDATDVLNQLEQENDGETRNHILMNDTLLENEADGGVAATTAAAAAAAPNQRGGSNTKLQDEALRSSKMSDHFATSVPSTGIQRYLRHLFVLMYYKNLSLIARQPIYLLLLVLSNTCSVLLSWPAGRNADSDTAVYIPVSDLTACYTIPSETFSPDISRNITDDIQLSYNENFRDGIPVTVMALGPLFFSIVTYLILHDEISIHMFNVVRQIGVADSCYWLSWYIPFCALAFVNSFLATCVAKLLPVHVYESTYFMGILGSLFFLHIALIGSSMFLATVQGLRKRFVIFFLMIMIIAIWMPYFTLIVQSEFYVDAESASGGWGNGGQEMKTPTKLFWVYQQTEVTNYNYRFWENGTETMTTETCHIPIVSEQESNLYKTPEQRQTVPMDQFFTGCYIAAGWGATSWSSTRDLKLGTAIWWFFPYYHFLTIWGNFCGYTAYDPAVDFTSEQMSMTAGQLARDALPIPNRTETRTSSSLFQQGSMIHLQPSSNYFSECTYGGCPQFLSNCPAQDYNFDGVQYDFCDNVEFMEGCPRALNPSPAEGKSVFFMFVILTAVSFTYMLMAAYWGIVFLGGAGTYPMYFFLLPSYWFGVKDPSPSATTTAHDNARTNDDGAPPHCSRFGNLSADASVKVVGVSKSYGNVRALQPVTFEMARGEVTALLGHNGAGKTTLSKVLTCETAPTDGDIHVFGRSIKSEANAIRRMVGVCKQDDYLWPNLSAKEHIDLFAGLRGVDPMEHDVTVQKWLESVDLDTVQHQQSSQFSGGMKRRLSLAMSTIGSRALIVLDEPTTGMDPVSRRFVWKHIDEIKKDRVVLLTTHAMEEADLLADMVAIMRKGKLAAFGSPLELKSEHGSALQFSVMVDKSRVSSTEAMIRSHFGNLIRWVKIDAGEAGNISVTIRKIQQSENEEGVDVETLTSFVAWLEDSENSGVTEYGFSNSSLEEVFLKITEGDVDDAPTSSGDQGTVSSEVDDQTPETRTILAAYKPNLTVRSQVMALVWQNFIRSWTGKRSLGNWAMYFLCVALNTVVFIWLGHANNSPPFLTIAVIIASFVLMSICSGIYGDRAEGLFYLMQAQGLLKNSYLIGTVAYGFLIAFVYETVLFGALYVTPFFRAPTICTPNYDTGEFCETRFGDNPVLFRDSVQQVTYLTNIDDDSIKLFAYPAPGGYELVFGAGFIFALTFPGAALASSYLPGQKFALLCIAILMLMACITPLITYFLPVFISESEELQECTERVVPLSVCLRSVANKTLGEDFLNCVGIVINSQQSYCTPAYTALLPQYGLFQMLGMSMMSDIKFFTEPAEFNEEVFIPSISGGYCLGDTCSFPYAKKLYFANLGWSIIGSVILTIIGVAVAHIFAFPTRPVLYVKGILSHAWESIQCRRGNDNRSDSSDTFQNELEEVQLERKTVEAIIQPLLTSNAAEKEVVPAIADYSKIVRNDLPPILTHKLSKVYPSFGRVPPKVALKSLDLHVTRGQVLGFLGKNGAGKTTALKILAGAHDASSGIGLVSGYDVNSERIQVFERLGNCPQFDVIWPSMTVKEHLLFFAKLKGIPRSDISSACQNIATAVGLGEKEVYNRGAGALSGGMRRRLSIAISLVGAPSVFVLDEPTTGLDPSTRNNIWGLVNSFATEDRAIVITTHMMLEADTLCNRIAIISKGELVVVATQQRLKDKFGSGYLLQLNLVKSTEENQAIAMDFVQQQLHRGATLQTKQAKTLHINLPRDLDLKRAFAALYTPTIRPECINQFLLSQSSLEDVFIALGD